MPSVVFGPGNCTVAHSTDEWVSVAEVVAAARILLVAAVRWCGAR
jgi:acetylornithine deacetylase/succinyl-diaminopimelate desuccinylase-like protein